MIDHIMRDAVDFIYGILDSGGNTGLNSTVSVATDVYDKSGNIIAQNFGKGNLSALIAELTFDVFL